MTGRGVNLDLLYRPDLASSVQRQFTTGRRTFAAVQAVERARHQCGANNKRPTSCPRVKRLCVQRNIDGASGPRLRCSAIFAKLLKAERCNISKKKKIRRESGSCADSCGFSFDRCRSDDGSREDARLQRFMLFRPVDSLKLQRQRQHSRLNKCTPRVRVACLRGALDVPIAYNETQWAELSRCVVLRSLQSLQDNELA